MWTRGIKIEVTSKNVCHPRCIPCIPTKEMCSIADRDYSKIYRTKSTLPRFWIAKKDHLRLNRSRCIRSNGVITQKKRLLGRLRNFYVRTSPIVYLMELVCNHAQPLPLPFESKYKKNDLNIKRVNCKTKTKGTSF
jgi:hypothetical protein